jgi:hypothetical protein
MAKRTGASAGRATVGARQVQMANQYGNDFMGKHYWANALKQQLA